MCVDLCLLVYVSRYTCGTVCGVCLFVIVCMGLRVSMCLRVYLSVCDCVFVSVGFCMPVGLCVPDCVVGFCLCVCGCAYLSVCTDDCLCFVSVFACVSLPMFVCRQAPRPSKSLFSSYIT